MKFAQLMESRFQRILLINFGVATLVLLIYGFITIRQTQEKATDFIFSHINQIAQAEVSAQSISDIDREVGQLFGAWKATQDFDIRIDVFLNGKLVGHAGELQKLGPLSVTKIKNFVLPSGQELSLQIDLDVTAHVLFVSLILLILVSFLGVTFFMIRRSARESARVISRPLEEKIHFVTHVARNLPASVREQVPASNATIRELVELDGALRTLFDEILNLEDRLVKAAVDKGRLEMAEEVAHNLKSALSVIQLRVENSASIGEIDRAHLRAAIRDLSKMSQRFIKQSTQTATAPIADSSSQVLQVQEAISTVVSAKKDQYKGHLGVSIEFMSSATGSPLVKASEAEFKAMISNLIDNSVEALNAGGSILVSLENWDRDLRIIVKDYGIGIPADILPKLMSYRATFGKPNGTGLGLFHAKKFVSALGGDIQINSEVGKGTAVTITLPRMEGTATRTIELIPSQTVVILDDEECIHAAWDVKFQEVNGTVSLQHLRSVEEFEQWMSANGLGEPGSRIYLSDFDLKSKSTSGLDLIEKYQIQFEAFLVTGMSNDLSVAERARKIGLRVIPKDDLHLVTLKVMEQEQTEHVI